ncbi:hypothetical protein FRC10_004315 [Ceratobasidium sp. 414]|nr:hypothetical protein FRC10_004315 [Ceratobasidium sp. 414]
MYMTKPLMFRLHPPLTRSTYQNPRRTTNTMAPKQPAVGVKHKFIIDYSRPAGEEIFDAAAFEDYLRSRIKVEGKTGQLGDKIKITRDLKKLTITSTVPLSKRYIKYLTGKFLKKIALREYLRPIATSKDTYELRYRIQLGDDEDDA